MESKPGPPAWQAPSGEWWCLGVSQGAKGPHSTGPLEGASGGCGALPWPAQVGPSLFPASQWPRADKRRSGHRGPSCVQAPGEGRFSAPHLLPLGIPEFTTVCGFSYQSDHTSSSSRWRQTQDQTPKLPTGFSTRSVVLEGFSIHALGGVLSTWQWTWGETQPQLMEPPTVHFMADFPHS